MLSREVLIRGSLIKGGIKGGAYWGGAYLKEELEYHEWRRYGTYIGLA